MSEVEEKKHQDTDENSKIFVKNMVEEKRVIESAYEFYGSLFDKFSFDKIFEKKSDSDLLKNLIVE